MAVSERGPPLPSRIASLIHAHFDALPPRSKPNIYPDGSREWIPMTGIVAVKGENSPSESLHCITLTSGAKCLSASHIPRCRGLILHDCHAEILALRAFNHWLLTECHAYLAEKHTLSSDIPQSKETEQIKASSSLFIRLRNSENGQANDSESSSIEWPPFEIQPDVNLYMYCTCAPCGDASMELCMAAQEDATPWEVVRQVDSNSTVQEDPEGEYLLDGRAHFSRLGVVRRKPARTDAESTRSKSCSDKLALRQVSSLLSSETSRLVAPNANAYLTGLILPEDEISKVACDRSFGEKGRMEALAGKLWPSRTISDEGGIGYQFRPFQVLSVPEREIKLLWKFAKPKTITPRSTMPSGERPPKKSKPGNVSAIWTAAPSAIHSYDMISDSGVKSLPSLCRSKTGLYETVINGVKQGNRATSPSSRGASALSRAKLWSLLQTIIQTDEFSDHSDNLEKKMPHSGTLQRILTANTYEEFKRAGNDITDPIRFREEAVQDAKKVLKGWISNTGDEGWGLDVLLDSKKRKR